MSQPSNLFPQPPRFWRKYADIISISFLMFAKQTSSSQTSTIFAPLWAKPKYLFTFALQAVCILAHSSSSSIEPTWTQALHRRRRMYTRSTSCKYVWRCCRLSSAAMLARDFACCPTTRILSKRMWSSCIISRMIWESASAQFRLLWIKGSAKTWEKILVCVCNSSC